MLGLRAMAMALPCALGLSPQPSRMQRITGLGLGMLGRKRIGISGRRSKLLLDAQQLVVFADAVGAAGRSRLDLSHAGGYGEIGDESVFRFAGAMRYHRGVAVVAGQFDRRDRL